MERYTKESLDDFDAVLHDWIATDMPLPDGQVWDVLIGRFLARSGDSRTVGHAVVTPLENIALGVEARTENSRYLLGVMLGGRVT